MCFYVVPPVHCLYRNCIINCFAKQYSGSCIDVNLSGSTKPWPESHREFKDLTFDDAELFPILVGRVCHQNIYDLVQIWKSDEAMHRHESTTLETSNKNAWKWHWERRFCVFFGGIWRKATLDWDSMNHCTMARLWRTEREYTCSMHHISLFCQTSFPAPGQVQGHEVVCIMTSARFEWCNWRYT